MMMDRRAFLSNGSAVALGLPLLSGGFTGAGATVQATARARASGDIALNAVFDRITHMELAPDEVYERVTFFMMRGPKHMRVQFSGVT